MQKEVTEQKRAETNIHKHLVQRKRDCTNISLFLDKIEDSTSEFASNVHEWSIRIRAESERQIQELIEENSREEKIFLEKVKKSPYIQEGETPEEFLERIKKELLG